MPTPQPPNGDAIAQLLASTVSSLSIQLTELNKMLKHNLDFPPLAIARLVATLANAADEIIEFIEEDMSEEDQ